MPPPSSPVSTAPSHGKPQQAECSRETVYQHARKVESRLAAEPGPLELRHENRRLGEAIAGLERGAGRLVRCDKAKLRDWRPPPSPWA